MIELPWPTGPEQEPSPQPEAGPARRSTEGMPLRWVPREVLESPHAHMARRGRHRATEEVTPGVRVSDVLTTVKDELVDLEVAWAEKDIGTLYSIWLGAKGIELDRRFPHAKFRQAARNRLDLLGEHVKAIEADIKNPIRIVGRVSMHAIPGIAALTEPMDEHPVIKDPNQL